eukprot:3635470-Pleurochrysis_carterae.AAC.2
MSRARAIQKEKRPNCGRARSYLRRGFIRQLGETLSSEGVQDVGARVGATSSGACISAFLLFTPFTSSRTAPFGNVMPSTTLFSSEPITHASSPKMACGQRRIWVQLRVGLNAVVGLGSDDHDERRNVSGKSCEARSARRVSKAACMPTPPRRPHLEHYSLLLLRGGILLQSRRKLARRLVAGDANSRSV